MLVASEMIGRSASLAAGDMIHDTERCDRAEAIDVAEREASEIRTVLRTVKMYVSIRKGSV